MLLKREENKMENIEVVEKTAQPKVAWQADRVTGITASAMLGLVRGEALHDFVKPVSVKYRQNGSIAYRLYLQQEVLEAQKQVFSARLAKEVAKETQLKDMRVHARDAYRAFKKLQGW